MSKGEKLMPGVMLYQGEGVHSISVNLNRICREFGLPTSQPNREAIIHAVWAALEELSWSIQIEPLIGPGPESEVPR